MMTKENLQVQLKRICGDRVEEMNLKLLLQVTQGGIHFLLAAVLSAGELFGVCSPFGVALVGASGAGLAGTATLLGAMFGYLSLHSFSLGLRYVSACILTYALAFCFYDLRILRNPWVMAGMTAVISGVTGFVYLSHGGWTPEEVIFFLAELVAVVVFTWGFGLSLLPLRFEARRVKLDLLSQRIAATLLGCGLLVSLSGVVLWDGVSLGRILGVVVILAFAWQEGPGVGAILGVTAGISLDLSVFSLPIYGMAWGFSAMCAGFFREKARLHSALAFLMANGTTVLWSLDEAGSFGILYEVLIGALVFCLVPVTWLNLCRLPVGEGETQSMGDFSGVRGRLEETAKAFQVLGETLKTAFRAPENQNDVGVVFQRTANKVCPSCYLRSTCWEREYVSTFNAMNDASGKMMARGKALQEDFPLYFSHRCLHFKEYLEEVNRQVMALQYRRQYNNRVRESRVAVCAQYGQLSQLLQQASAQISQELTPQVKKAGKVSRYLAYLGIDAKVVLMENHLGMLQGEIVGEETECLETEQGLAELSGLLEVPLSLEREGARLVLQQLEPFMVLAGFASSKKEGERVCGDRSNYFKREDGVLFVLVCDGMGSGPQARGESTLASELLEQFLRAGVDSLQALGILSSALALRGEDMGGFTTVDLLELNLMTGRGVLYKYGAAPTYYKRGKEIRRIVGQSLPAGADFGQQSKPDQIQLALEPEDCLLLVSDGVSGAGEEDQWLCGLFQEFDGESMKEFSRFVVEQTPEGGKDDRTAVVVKMAVRD